MKKVSIILTSLLLIILTSIGIMSCQKDNANNELAIPKEPLGTEILERILDFKNKVEFYKTHPNTRDAFYVSTVEAVWNLESLFNYTYAYPELCYGETVTIDTIMHLPVNDNDSVLMSDLVLFYGNMFEAVRDIYKSVTLPNKQFVILDVEEGFHNQSFVNVVLHTVQGSVTVPPLGPSSPNIGPFPPNVSWGYGENMGNSLGQHIGEMDAADTLSILLNAELVPVAPEGYCYVYVGINYKQTGENLYPFSHPFYPNLGPYCEFYKENPVFPDDYWLTPDQMNFHYLGEKHLITNILPYEDPAIHPDKNIFFIEIEDYADNDLSAIGHRTKVWFGYELMISENDKDKEVLD